MRLATPQHIYNAYKKCEKYLLDGLKIDDNAPDDAKEAFKIWLDWEREHEDFM